METMLAKQQHKTFSKKFLKDYVITMRPYLLFVSGITGICGMSFITDISISKSILIFLASFLSYGFGQALTDCFQTDTDSISSPYRPLTKGVISKSQVLSISVIGLIICVSIFSIFNSINLLLGILSGLGLATYTYFKKKFWAGPFYNAWIVSVLFLMAFLCGSDLSSVIQKQNVLYALAAVFFGYANFVLVGYFKDVEADRPTGYNTLPVVFGRRVASIASNIFGLLSIIATILVITYSLSFNEILRNNIYVAMILAAGIIVMTLCQIFVHFIKSDDESSKAINLSVHAYILLLSSIVVLNKIEWLLPIIAFHVLFNITIALRPEKNQI
jgi:geranylgeranylglycerol-phosphate geranylgeranyltransferase